MPPLPDRHRRPRPPTCWEIAVRRANQARERQRRRRGRSDLRSASAVVRNLLLSLEGSITIALMMTLAVAAIEMVTAPLRRPAQRSAALPPSRLPAPVRRPTSVYGLEAFDDALVGETLQEYELRHRPEAVARYRESPRTQALYLHRALGGKSRASDRLAPALAEALAGLGPAARQTLALVPPERLVRLLPGIAAGEYAVVAAGPPPDELPGDEPDGGGQAGAAP